MSIQAPPGIFDAALTGVSRGAKRLAETPPPGELASKRAYTIAANAIRNTLVNPTRGLPLPAGASFGGALNQLKFSAQASDISGVGPSSIMPSYPTSQAQNANQRVVYNRILFALPKKTILELPSEKEIVILRRIKNKTGNMAAYTSNPFAKLGGAMDALWATNVGRARELIQTEPVHGVNPIAFNFLMAEKCREMMADPVNNSRAYNTYRHLTMGDIWYGDQLTKEHIADFALPEWCGWSIDGVARIEEGADGNSTASNDGFRQSSVTGAVDASRANRPLKHLTVVGCGETPMLNVVGNQGMQAGARLWAVLRKGPLAEMNHTRQTYVVSHKSAVLAAQAATRNNVTEVINVRGANPALGEKYPMRPPQLYFFMTPDGSIPPPWVRNYEDEWGVWHNDGILMSMGRVLYAPKNMTFRESALPDNMRPLTDGSQVMQLDDFIIVLDADHDGLLASM